MVGKLFGAADMGTHCTQPFAETTYVPISIVVSPALVRAEDKDSQGRCPVQEEDLDESTTKARFFVSKRSDDLISEIWKNYLALTKKRALKWA
ncbi:hypothetical protein E6O75_ATG11702 [Venturia nashicola]|uniref:Uncharacterized protein n=1 Tax=Venturia nashicola TaxID=86259 RepID=A0A4Z1NZD5_9PEZI|nr:hypothetical protein E6O75_ATG11702 [Venturia nashicola]